ncbi:penicillin acylase family protein [Pararhodobacter sp.]|uniref:penicillin acylase family protein n=1 Tax=Pararhodobacter sp. TaxID=2127056 RepID=UPI002FDEBF29
MPSDQAAASPLRHRLAGLTAPVEIAVDRFGLAHIRAENRDDLFFAQGFNAARDRLWQIDLWRKRGLGLLAADFGPGYLAQDHAARLMLYRGDMAPEWAAYAPDAEEICTAFAAGINAYITEVEAGRAPLPLEFARMDTRPARWQAADVVRIRSHCLTRNALSEVIRARILGHGGAQAAKLDALRMQVLPPVDPVGAPDLDLASIPLEVLETFRLATAPVSFSPERLAARLEDAGRWRGFDALGDVVQLAQAEGSNNWAIGPERSATGRAIMALDPHRVHALPSVRYLVHLSMPGFDAIGAGEAAVPGISMGHNGNIAFSLTIFGADQEDVHVHDTAPDDPLRYRFGEGWREMTVVEERFRVRGCPDQVGELHFTHLGPVLHRDPGNQRAYALRTVWSDPGAAPYMASLSVMRAQNHDDYREALRGWGTPSINHVYADTSGSIAWQAVGATPLRHNWNGLVPVPGDGRYEWAGYRSLEELPASVNPESGFVATANEMNLPQGWNHDTPGIGYEWIDHSRAGRIKAVLGAGEKLGLQDCCALQNDLHSRTAARGCAVLARLALTSPQARAAQAHLAGWDHVLAPGSSPAALHEVWVTRHLFPALAKAFGAKGAFAALLLPGDVQSVTDVLERPEAWFDSDPQAQLATLIDQTLAAAWEDCRARLGDDPAGWEWGAVHKLALTHPLAAVCPDVPAFRPAPLALGGSGSTVALAAYRPSDFAAVVGPSVRMVIDVGAWDSSLFVNTPGQSGDPESSHYNDLQQDWLNGGYKPLSYSRAAVDAVTETLIVLEPAA